MPPDPSPTPPALPLVRLTVRRQFLKLAAKGRKTVRPTLVLQSLRLSPDDQQRAKILARKTHLRDAVFVGFTASKKVGNAVARNRAKRRLRALSAQMIPGRTLPGTALVLIARARTVTAPFADLQADLAAALGRRGQDFKAESKPVDLRGAGTLRAQ